MQNGVDERYYYNYNLLNIDMQKQVCAIMDFKNHEMHKRVFNPNFKCHTLTTCGGGNTQKRSMITADAENLLRLNTNDCKHCQIIIPKELQTLIGIRLLATVGQLTLLHTY